MQIGLIIYGQPRFINNPNCYESHKKWIYSQGKVDTFAHLWTPKNDEYHSSSWSGIKQCIASSNDVEVFHNKWKPISLRTEIEKEFDTSSFSILKDRFPDPHWNLSDYHKLLSHLYSLEKSIEEFEKSNGKYDFVIITRTDVCIWQFPYLNDLEKNRFYYSSIFHQDHFADIAYIADPKYVSGLKAYSMLMSDPTYVFENVPIPSAEQIKRLSFLTKFGKDPLKQIPLPVRVVRDNFGNGPQW